MECQALKRYEGLVAYASKSYLAQDAALKKSIIALILEIRDDREESSSQDGYETEFNHSMDIKSGDKCIADDASATT
jgi:hypothetical protein